MAQRQPLNASRPHWQRYLAEFIGTFFVVFGAHGAFISNCAVTLPRIAQSGKHIPGRRRPI